MEKIGRKLSVKRIGRNSQKTRKETLIKIGRKFFGKNRKETFCKKNRKELSKNEEGKSEKR